MKRQPNYTLIAGCALTVITVSAILVSFFWTPYDPSAISAKEIGLAPSLEHLFGTDNKGRDIFSRVMQGAGSTLSIAFCAVLISCVLGTVIGALTGYFGGVADEIVMRVNDAVTSCPSVLIALVVVSIVGHGRTNIIIVLGILFIPSFARVVRGEFAKHRHRDYVKNARLMGATNWRIITAHILPNIAPVLMSSIAIGFNNAVLAEASMSFLGIGVLPTEGASLGVMLKESQSCLTSAPWLAIATGISISVMILGFALLSEGFGYKPAWKSAGKQRRKPNA